LKYLSPNRDELCLFTTRKRAEGCQVLDALIVCVFVLKY